MLKTAKSFKVLFIGIMLLYMVHSPCICGLVFPDKAQHSCAAEQPAPEKTVHSCCHKESTEKTAPVKTSTGNCPSGKCCSNWFYYLKTTDFNNSETIYQVSTPFVATLQFASVMNPVFDFAQTKPYWLLHPPGNTQLSKRSSILRI